jgi:two-component system, sensor histidine kinase LadS
MLTQPRSTHPSQAALAWALWWHWTQGLKLLLCLVLCVHLPSVQAEHSGHAIASGQIINLEGHDTAVGLNGLTTVWLDAPGQATGEQAAAAARAGAFTYLAHPKPVLLHPSAALWQRIEVRRSGATDWYLQIGSPSVDHVSLHWQDENGRWVSQVSGDSVAVAQWPIPDRLPTFAVPANLKVQPDGVSELWLRVAHARLPIWADATLVPESVLRQSSEASDVLFGGFFGVLLISLAVTAWQFSRSGDRVLLAYFGLVLSMGLVQLQLTGLSGQFLLDNLPVWNDRVSYLFGLLYGIAGVNFVANACSISRYSARLNGLCYVWLLLGLSLVVLNFVWLDRLMWLVANSYLVACVALMVGLALWSRGRGDRYARWILWGILPAMVGAMFPLVRNFGWIQTGVLSQYGPMAGATLELVILMLVLTRRHQNLFETQLRQNASQATDPLTGLAHESLFAARLNESLLRCTRNKVQCAVVSLELANLDAYSKTTGTAAAERALVLAASRMRTVARDVDAAARVGTGRFLLLLDGPVKPDELTRACQLLLSRLLQPADVLPSWGNLEMRIRAVMLPNAELSPSNTHTASTGREVIAAMLRQLSVDKSEKTIAIVANEVVS